MLRDNDSSRLPPRDVTEKRHRTRIEVHRAEVDELRHWPANVPKTARVRTPLLQWRQRAGLAEDTSRLVTSSV